MRFLLLFNCGDYINQQPVILIFGYAIKPSITAHSVAFGSSLQLGPILIPASYLYFNCYIRVLDGINIAHGLHSGTLVNIPNLKHQMGLAII